MPCRRHQSPRAGNGSLALPHTAASTRSAPAPRCGCCARCPTPRSLFLPLPALRTFSFHPSHTRRRSLSTAPPSPLRLVAPPQHCPAVASRWALPIALARLPRQPFVVSSRQPPSLHRTTTPRRAHAPIRPRLLRSSPRPVSSSRAQRPQPAFDHSAHSRSCTSHHSVATLSLRVTCTPSELAKVKHRPSSSRRRLRPRRARPSAGPPRPTAPSPSEGPTYVKFHLTGILPVVVRSCSCSFSCFSRDPSISGPRRWPSATQR